MLVQCNSSLQLNFVGRGNHLVACIYLQGLGLSKKLKNSWKEIWVLQLTREDQVSCSIFSWITSYYQWGDMFSGSYESIEVQFWWSCGAPSMGASYITSLSVSGICTIISFVILQWWTQWPFYGFNPSELVTEYISQSEKANHVIELISSSYATILLLANFALNVFGLLLLCIKVITCLLLDGMCWLMEVITSLLKCIDCCIWWRRLFSLWNCLLLKFGNCWNV